MMRTLLLVVVLAALAACGDATGPESREWINVSGEYVSDQIAGVQPPVRSGTFMCEGAEIGRYVVLDIIGLYDRSPDPAAADPAYYYRVVSGEDGECWTETNTDGEYRATADSIFFDWDEPLDVGDAAWLDGTRGFAVPVAEGRAVFDRFADSPGGLN